jgi:hypothetical protein
MRPNGNYVRAGRAKSDRKAIFHGAVSKEIAIKEMRSWIGSYVSVAIFKIKRELKTIDFFTAYCGIYQSIALAIKRKKMKGKDFDDYVWNAMEKHFASHLRFRMTQSDTCRPKY